MPTLELIVVVLLALAGRFGARPAVEDRATVGPPGPRCGTGRAVGVPGRLVPSDLVLLLILPALLYWRA